jgi:thiol-disulfide isomerase/thioredoxin
MKTLVYVAIALAAGAVGYGIYQYGIAPQLAKTSAPPAAEDVPAPQIASTTADDLKIPSHLPEFTLTDREGATRSIRSWPGKSMIVNFWATWCAPCRREIPLLNQIQSAREADGFQVVGIAVDFREDVLTYADEIGIDYPLLIGEQDGLDAIAKFGIAATGFPFTVFTDQQSRIVLTHLGELTEPESKVILNVVGQVNRGELTPQAARVVAAKQLADLEHASPAA